MGKYTALDEEQQLVCRANGIDPEAYVFVLDNERYMILLNLKTRDTVTIRYNEERRKTDGSQ